MRTISVDFETYYSKDYSVQELGAWAYSDHPQFDPYMISVYDGEEAWVGHPSKFNWAALEGAQLVSHNAAFDKTVFEAMVRKGMAPEVRYHAWECSANLSAFLAGSDARDLKSASKILLGQEVAKEMRNWIKGRSWESVLKLFPARVERMLEYAKQDAIRCWEIWTHMLPHWPDRERKLAKLTMDCTAYGVAVDTDRLKQYLTVVAEEKWRLEKELPWILEGEKAGSASALCNQCRAVGIPSPPLKKDDAAAFDVWQAEHQERFPWVGAVGRWRKTGKLLSFLETVKARLRPEDNCFSVETPLKYYGAHTGRWSGDSLNFQNMRRDPLVIGDHSIDVRGLFIPRPGNTLFVADYSQIEPRVLAWLAGDTQMLDLVRRGFAVYEAHARATMGWTGGVLKDEDKDLYKLAKARVLGLGYGCGWSKFIVVAFAMAGLRLSAEEAKRTVADFRSSNPKITALWRLLDSKLEEAVRDGLTLKRELKQDVGGQFDLGLPSGRELHYLNVKREPVIRNRLKNANPDSDDAIPEHERKGRMETVAGVGGRRRSVYGALLTENLTQATARDVFVEALLELDRCGFKVPFHTHDEFVIDLPKDTDDREVLSILRKCPEWLAGCPIDVEANRMERYAK